VTVFDQDFFDHILDFLHRRGVVRGSLLFEELDHLASETLSDRAIPSANSYRGAIYRVGDALWLNGTIAPLRLTTFLIITFSPDIILHEDGKFDLESSCYNP